MLFEILRTSKKENLFTPHTIVIYLQLGYHRYWSHRSYDATKLFQFILCCAGSGAMEGSIKWWSRHHRAHHRYTDTERDPYSAKKGLFWTHIGWMIFKENPKYYGKVDISDLNMNPIVKFQHKNYLM